MAFIDYYRIRVLPVKDTANRIRPNMGGLAIQPERCDKPIIYVIDSIISSDRKSPLHGIQTEPFIIDGKFTIRAMLCHNCRLETPFTLLLMKIDFASMAFCSNAVLDMLIASLIMKKKISLISNNLTETEPYGRDDRGACQL